jgi:hypothetical protein
MNNFKAFKVTIGIDYEQEEIFKEIYDYLKRNSNETASEFIDKFLQWKDKVQEIHAGDIVYKIDNKDEYENLLLVTSHGYFIRLIDKESIKIGQTFETLYKNYYKSETQNIVIK